MQKGAALTLEVRNGNSSPTQQAAVDTIVQANLCKTACCPSRSNTSARVARPGNPMDPNTRMGKPTAAFQQKMPPNYQAGT
eukprot:4144875-Amphidinium_carterae.1